MTATFRAAARIPAADWPAGRDPAEADLRVRVVELAVGAGAVVPDLVEVDVEWRREDELWRDPEGPHDAPLSTRTVMVGTAVLAADLGEDAVEWESMPHLTQLEGASDPLTGVGVRLASGQMVTALQVDEERRASTLVCGSPQRRHSFPRHEAIALRDGLLTSSVCGDCGRRVERDELVRNANAEADGVRWWE